METEIRDEPQESESRRRKDDKHKGDKRRPTRN
jgi:hypothetical protein